MVKEYNFIFNKHKDCFVFDNLSDLICSNSISEYLSKILKTDGEQAFLFDYHGNKCFYSIARVKNEYKDCIHLIEQKDANGTEISIEVKPLIENDKCFKHKNQTKYGNTEFVLCLKGLNK